MTSPGATHPLKTGSLPAWDIPATGITGGTIDDLGEQAEPNWSAADTALMALSLFTVWTARTGRVLPGVPVAELTAEELVEFWAYDQLEEPYASMTFRCYP